MRNYLTLTILFIFMNSFGQDIYENDLYEFKIYKNSFELSSKYDNEEYLYESRKSICLLLAKGNIKKEENFYYKFNSFHSSELFKSKLIKSEYQEELKDSLTITVKINNFNLLDYNNFTFATFDSFYKVNVKEIDNATELKITIPKLWASDFILYAYPENKDLLLSDDAIGLSFSNQLKVSLFSYDLSSLKHQYNNFYFEMTNFNPCDLYLKYFDGDFVKIKKDKLYWKDMVFVKK